MARKTQSLAEIVDHLVLSWGQQFLDLRHGLSYLWSSAVDSFWLRLAENAGTRKEWFHENA